MVLSAAQEEATLKIGSRRIGPALLFERLWEETGCRKVIEEVAGARKQGMALERAIFRTVLHRLFVSGSDRAADRWREDYQIGGLEGLTLHHLYRAMAWLGEELPAKEQDGRTPFAPRCTKDVVEERLFSHRRDLFTRLDLVFRDTPDLYFSGAGAQGGRAGLRALHRLPQPSGSRQGRRRSRRDPRRVGADAQDGRQGAHRQHRLSPLPEDDPRSALRDRP